MPNCNLKDRIRLAIDIAGGMSTIVDLTNISKAMLCRYTSEKSKEPDPSTSKLIKIANAANVTVEWLATGKGSMHYNQEKSFSTDKQDYSLVPLYDGQASTAHKHPVKSEKIIEYIPFSQHWLQKEGLILENLAALTAQGDSMEPTLHAGTILMMDSSRLGVTDNAIYIIQMDQYLYAKRLQRMLDGSVSVISDNPAYQTETVAYKNISLLNIVGRVVWIGQII